MKNRYDVNLTIKLRHLEPVEAEHAPYRAWTAVVNVAQDGFYAVGEGHTPEEAVGGALEYLRTHRRLS